MTLGPHEGDDVVGECRREEDRPEATRNLTLDTRTLYAEAPTDHIFEAT
jgi:hypothetical protein